MKNHLMKKRHYLGRMKKVKLGNPKWLFISNDPFLKRLNSTESPFSISERNYKSFINDESVKGSDERLFNIRSIQNETSERRSTNDLERWYASPYTPLTKLPPGLPLGPS
jgi:hypothetical protein